VPERTAIKFSNPNFGNLAFHVASSAARKLPFVQRDFLIDRPGAVICALGNSMQDEEVIEEVRKRANDGWAIFGLKEAATFLREHDIAVEYSCNMDPGPQEADRIPVYPEVTYFLASSCHPVVFDSVLDRGGHVVVYHSACGVTNPEVKAGFVLDVGMQDRGFPDQAIATGVYEMETIDGGKFTPFFTAQTNEVDYYWQHFGIGDTVIGGFTVANRALGLAKYGGADNVLLAGADFGWRTNVNDESYYAKFVAAKPLQDVWMSDNGSVDGTPWSSRPDLLASAVDIARRIKQGAVEVIGDSLALALSKREDDYINNVCRINE
jgi:hypothetical protein